ncbi:MAG: hypothetical protein QME74_03185, partial [Candidatus Edwardsbacteria bacterium]|nr:hypothetical protein [Candidatus Edwardsbacteria bacterium]
PAFRHAGLPNHVKGYHEIFINIYSKTPKTAVISTFFIDLYLVERVHHGHLTVVADTLSVIQVRDPRCQFYAQRPHQLDRISDDGGAPR